MLSLQFKSCAALSLLLCGIAQGVQYTASLSGPNENPPNASPGTGTALVTYDDVAHTYIVEVTFSGLLSTTTVAHIHAPAVPPANVGVATFPGTFPGFPTGVTAGTYSSPSPIDLTLTSSFTAGFLTLNGGTAAGAEAGLASALAAGQAYFNIHTVLFPGGEIRGFLTPVSSVPDTSATAPLLALGLMAMLGFARYQRAA